MKTIKVQMKDIVKLKTKSRDTPVLDYCRTLIEQGEDPNSRLEVYRNNSEPDIIAPNIGKAAQLTVREDDEVGPVFRKYQPFPNNRIAK